MTKKDLFFEAIKQDALSTNLTETFGLIREQYTYSKKVASGSFTDLEFETWKIQEHIMKESYVTNISYALNDKSNYLILSMNGNTPIQWLNNKHKRELKGNTGVFLNTPKENFQLTKETTLHFIIIEFKEAFFHQNIFNNSVRNYLKQTLKNNDGVTFHVENKLKGTIEKIVKADTFGLCQLMDMNNKVFEMLSTALAFSSIPKEKAPLHPYYKQLEEVKHHINKNLETQFSIDTLSKIVGLNTSYLKKYFKEAFDITIFEYSQKKRIDYAKKLLEKPTFTVANISEKVGYQQSAHFSHAFKRNTGLSPNQYRKIKSSKTTLQ